MSLPIEAGEGTEVTKGTKAENASASLPNMTAATEFSLNTQGQHGGTSLQALVLRLNKPSNQVTHGSRLSFPCLLCRNISWKTRYVSSLQLSISRSLFSRYLLLGQT